MRASRASACPTRIAPRRKLRSARKATPQQPPPHIAAAVEQAKRYFAGERIDFAQDRARSRQRRSVPPLDLRRAAPVAFGETVTYGELAKRAGVNAPQPRRTSASRWRAIRCR